MNPKRNAHPIFPRLILLALILLTFGGVFIFYLVTRPSPHCDQPVSGTPQSGVSARVLVDEDGDEHCYLFYVPKTHMPDQPAMVVVTLHGYLSNPEGIMLIDGWRKIAEREGFILIYPQGTGYPLGWNGSSTFSSQRDDIQFLREVIRDLGSLFVIDNDRVYINGVSNGGMLSINALCLASDIFAAAGSVGAPIEFEQMACVPERPSPLILFHGLGDPGMPYRGGEMKMLGVILGISPPPYMYPVEMYAASWSARIGCPERSQRFGPFGDVTVFIYGPCDAEAETYLFKLANRGHTWPGGPPIPFAGGATQDIHASEEMLDFFLRHPKR